MINILKMSQPYIETYPMFSNPLSILQNYDNAKDWVLNNFIQICSNTEALNFYDFNYKLCPFLNIERIAKITLNTLGINSIDFIINCLDMNKYCYLIINKQYIKSYQCNNYSKHDMFIYGYNSDLKIFYIADNFIYGKYDRKTCSFEELQDAITHLKEADERYIGFNGCIEAISYHDSKIKFKSMRVKDSLVNYIESKGTTLWNNLYFRNQYIKSDWKFGLECYYFLHNKIFELEETGQTSIQPFHLFWEHKKHLYRIFEYMLNNKMLKKSFDKIFFDNLDKNAIISRNMIIKFMENKNTNLITKLHKNFYEMEELEKYYLPVLIDLIIE